MSLSVLTLVRGRENHLRRLVEGLARQSEPPDELVIAYMQEEPFEDLPGTDFPVREIFVPGKELPLAAARNGAARSAQGEQLFFLDVDCIPGIDAVATLARGLGQENGVLMPEARYLPAGVPSGPLDFAELVARAQRHPARPPAPARGRRREIDYDRLWGLAFGIRRRTFFECGGLDERYVGYGGEETDFARVLELREVPLFHVAGACCFHQYHPVHRPPLQHFDAILRNAEIFHGKWGAWCMEYWLDWFERDGYIERRAGNLTVKRRPSEEDLAGAAAGDSHIFA